MGESEPIITLRDMYDVVVQTHGDVRELKVTLAAVVSQSDDHEDRIRVLESERRLYVRHEDLRERSGQSWTRTATISGLVATVVAVAEALLTHH